MLQTLRMTDAKSRLCVCVCVCVCAQQSACCWVFWCACCIILQGTVPLQSGWCVCCSCYKLCMTRLKHGLRVRVLGGEEATCGHSKHGPREMKGYKPQPALNVGEAGPRIDEPANFAHAKSALNRESKRSPQSQRCELMTGGERLSLYRTCCCRAFCK